MSWWERVRKALTREAAEANDLADEVQAKIEADLDRRERELRATPEERLQSAVTDAAEADAEFDKLARQIGDEHSPPAEEQDER